MKIIQALFRKDLASCRALIWLGTGCIVLDCLQFFGLVSTHRPDGQDPAKDLLNLSLDWVVHAWINQVILLVALVVRVIQSDLLVGPDAFWRTRPIPRKLLLAEKAILLALIITGTTLAAVCLRTDTDVIRAPHPLFLWSLIVLGVAAFAAVTEDFAKLLTAFTVISLGAIAALPVYMAAREFYLMNLPGYIDHAHSWGFHFLATASAANPDVSTPTRAALFPEDSWHWDQVAVYFIGFASAITCQYLTLRTRVSRWILFVTLFSSFVRAAFY